MLTIPTKLYKHCYVLGRLKEYLKLKKKKNREREREKMEGWERQVYKQA